MGMIITGNPISKVIRCSNGDDARLDGTLNGEICDEINWFKYSGCYITRR